MLRLLLIAGLVLAVGACASEPPRRAHRGGPAPGPEARFRRLFISPSGEPFRGPDGLKAWFARADTDHDGAISRAEFEADAMAFFKVLDANHDGVVDGFEIQAYEQNIAPEITALDIDRGQAGGGQRAGGQGRGGGGMGGGGRRGRSGGRRGGGGGSPQSADGGGGRSAGAGREGAARYSLINEPEPVAIADENLDSRVSLDEWKHATARRFAALDKAKTGRLTLDSLLGRIPPPPQS